jgi:hypothetical protein
MVKFHASHAVGQVVTVVSSVLLVGGLAANAAAQVTSGTIVTVTRAGPGLSPSELRERYRAEEALELLGTDATLPIAVLSAGEAALEDVAQFRREFGLPPVEVERSGVAPETPSGLEPTVLLQWAGALAPNAPLRLIVGRTVVEALAFAILDNVAPILVLPQVECTSSSRAAAAARFAARVQIKITVKFPIQLPDLRPLLMSLAASQGQIILVPTGNHGAACENRVWTRGPPLTGVGGTMLVDGAEHAWNDQDGATGNAPRVVALASPTRPGYEYVWAGERRCCAGGTGMAATVWAGAASLLDGGVEHEVSGYQDVVVGDTTFGGVPGVTAAEGFDAASGWGSPDVGGALGAIACAERYCTDRDPCTIDTCGGFGECAHTPAPDGVPCDDLDACTVGDACRGGTCRPGEPHECDDGGQCTLDACDPGQGCVYTSRDDGAAGDVCMVMRRPRARCSLEWHIETRSASTRRRTVRCTDGDVACDADEIAGQCTFRLGVCAPGTDGCRTSRIRVQRPSRAQTRRSPRSRAMLAAVESAVGGSPRLTAGQCTQALAVVVPADRISTKLQLAGGRGIRTPTIRLACRSAE